MRLKPSYPALRQGHPLADGLIGAWLMTEGSGNSLKDYSNSGNDGMFNRATPVWGPGANGPALDFNGTSAFVDDFGSYIVDSRSSFSISAWVYRRSTSTSSAGDVIVSTRTGNADGVYFWLNRSLSGSLAISPIGATALETPGDVVPLNGWSFVSVSHDKPGGITKLYVDGVIKASGDIAPGGTATAIADGRIGRSSGTTSRHFNGLISTVISHNRALTDQDIDQLHDDPFAMFRPRQRSYFALAGAAPPPSGFKPYWARRTTQILGGR